MWALEVGRRLFGHGLQGSGFPKQSMERVHFEEDVDTVGEEPEQDPGQRILSPSWLDVILAVISGNSITLVAVG